ncbi:MAG TPA: translocation/assembly module TamB domain-containing protein, partial [Flavitalea sp.]|nr:translocation/assembly module TamB domain-containing protein [Flavitalea sp.]
MGITGTYQLNSGHYNMNSKFLKGKFLLVDGSTITFNGDPEDAEANVTTEYDIDASPSGLLRPAEEEAYNMSKRLPFVIVLTMKGPISGPELAFDIKLKEGATGINSSLKSDVEEQLLMLRNDVSAMNKQVFSLLVMNQFTVYTTGDLASSDLSPDVALKQGMSQFLAEGMNSIASGLIKGVDINVNMESYKTADAKSRTDVGFEVSKDMLNDRLTVTVGKNFITGDNADEYQNSANQYVPDITTAYKLSKDGRYQVKAYRTNEYDAVVEGYFTETGVAFTIQLEYNMFKQIFQSQKKLQNE